MAGGAREGLKGWRLCGCLRSGAGSSQIMCMLIFCDMIGACYVEYAWYEGARESLGQSGGGSGLPVAPAGAAWGQGTIQRPAARPAAQWSLLMERN